MGYEIDFIPVGEGEKSGDAIALRFGNCLGSRKEYKVVVVDAGFHESGTKLFNHITKYYKTSEVDLAISTHPDSDHIAGLEVILNELEVKKLWMHQPWKHTGDISEMFKGGRVTDKSVKEALRKSLDDALDIERLAQSKKIPIEEPFQGVGFESSVFVLSPSKEFYESLLPGFRGTPEPKEDIFKAALEKIFEPARKVAERWDYETLDDTGETSAENNSSTVLLLRHEQRCSLLTAYARIPSINEAINYLNRYSFDYSKLRFVQAPHHGSKRNIGPTILNTLIGPKLGQDTYVKTAFVSVSSASDSKHPSKKVTNAFRRRGAPVHATAGSTNWHYQNTPKRDDFSDSVSLPFYDEVED
jgi:beta-lactamase superfamily II metal-dependent hydrolase